MKPITNFLIAGLMLLAASAFGQALVTTITPAAPTVQVGQTVDLQLKVQNFTNITSIQFSISYNNAALTYVSTDGFTLPGFAASNINSQPANGKLTVSWFPDFGTYPNGVTLNDNTAIFTMHFTALANGSSPVNLTTSPLAIEVTRNFSTITVNYQNGGSAVTVGSGGPPPVQAGFKIFANTIYIPKDSTRCMPVTVNDFDNIVSMQYAMHWDKNVLQYVKTQAYNLPGLDGGDFVANQNTGTLLCGWFDDVSNPPGVTRADGVKIYEVCFKGIGNAGTNSLITIDGVGFPPGNGSSEAYNGNSQNVWSNTPGNLSGQTDTIFVTAPPPPVNNLILTAEKDTAAIGSQVCIDVTATNFNDLLSVQFALSYNATQLTYQSLQLGSNPLNLNASNFNPSSGLVKFIWDDASLQGITLPANTVLFTVCFTVVGPANTSSAITLGTAPGFDVEVIRDPNVPITPTLNNGSVWMKQAAQATLSFSNIVNPTCNGGSTGTLSVNVQNGTANTYSWTGPDMFTSSQQNLTALKAGTYNVTVTLQGGSTITGSQTLTQPDAITLPAATPTAANCNGGSDGAIQITASGGTGTLTYAWTGPNGFVSSIEDLTGLKAGNYTVVVKDANNCSLTSSPILVSQPNPITVPTATLQVTEVICFGNATGAINISPTGGTAPYTFAWSNAAQTEDISGVSAGFYTVSITDSKNCPTYVSQSIQVQGPPSALAVSSSNVQNVKCFGELTGSAQANANGGWGGYSYLWKDQNNVTVGATAALSNVGAGTYHLTVTDTKGCSVTLGQPVSIQGPASAMTTSVQTSPAACAGTATGSIMVNVAGGYGGYTTSWSPSVPDPAHVAAGTYNLTVTDSGGCSDVENVTVSGANPITAGTPDVDHVTCASAGNGCITLALNGGTPNYNVSWSNGQSGQSICGLSGGNYTPTITDAAGCTLALPAITVNEPTALSISPTTVKQNGQDPNGSIDLNFNNGGVGPWTFNWTGPNGYANITSVDQISGLVAGTYNVTITDNSGCQLVQSIILQSENPLSISITGITPACGNDGCVTLAIAAGAQSPFVISWNGGTETTNSYEPSICNLAAGPYNLTVTDVDNNTFTLPLNVPGLQPAVAASNIVNPNQAFMNGSITMLQVIPGVTMQFAWNTGSSASSLINLDSGLYVVTITNPNSGCTTVQEFHLNRVYQPIQFVGLNDTDPTCTGSATGSISLSVVGGAEPYTYSWVGPNGYTAATEDISNLAAGTYNLTLTDAIGTTATQGPIVLTAQSALAITNVNELSIYPGGYQVSGPDDCDGAASVAFTGGIGTSSVLWSNGIAGISTETLCGGAYSVTVTDGLGCTSVWSDELNAPAPIASSALPLTSYNSYNVKCNGSCDGAARISVSSGGVGPYIFQWPASVPFNLITSGADFSQASGLCGGAYNVTITDANGNTKVQSVTLTEPDALTAVFTQNLPTPGYCDGQIIVDVDGGNGTDIAVEWTGNQGHDGTSTIADGLCAGEVVLFQITDEFGCEAVAQDTVDYPLTSCFSISEVVTPNNDGDNDYLKILCIEDSPSSEIEIYNRWGQLVFTVKGYVNGDPARAWYGTANNEPLAEGVYFYVLNYVDPVSGNTEQKKGYVNLLR